ncbi:hypothetical protein [Pseudomonas matsuisoli]|uniref:Uncharacterized protein n=1 Tax=Pseudomonas matsuisoli TaxID=1515666 RepID=A0A917PVA3_9PSED|nr:hypothetical protein [Pseudomonas matsuisoli]GGJ93514.1 hypothetical protein GCM10009304_19350 [Pseudomonas matsuisoli]
MRKIIQIQPLPASPNGASLIGVCALCDDGRIWLHDTGEESAWRCLPEIPGPTSAASASEKPPQAGKRWLPEDDEQLATLWCQQRFDVERIAKQMQRSDGAIVSRLVRLDFYGDRDEVREENQRRRRTATAVTHSPTETHADPLQVHETS